MLVWLANSTQENYEMAKKTSSSDDAGGGRLSNRTISRRLERLPGWMGKDRRKAIHRTYTFPTFRASLAFVTYVGEVAESLDHHPDIDIRFNKVTLTISTHSAGGLTEKDFQLAGVVDQ